MKKILKNPYIILSLILVLLIIVYIVLSNSNKKAEEKATQESEDAVIYVMKDDTLKSFSYTDGSQTIAFNKKGKKWVTNAAADVTLNATTMKSLESSFAKITATREMTANLEDLKSYGLDTPAYELTVTNEDGKKTTVQFGSTVSSDDGTCYAKVKGKDTIYVVDNSLESSFSFDLTSLVAVPDIPTLSKDNITSVEQVSGASGSTKTLKPEKKTANSTTASMEERSETADSSSIGTTSSSAEKTTPFEQAATGLSSLYIQATANYQPTAAELKTYGLDEDNSTMYTVTYTDDDKEEQKLTFYVGGQDDSGTYAYIKVDGEENSQVVYQISLTTAESLKTAFKAE